MKRMILLMLSLLFTLALAQDPPTLESVIASGGADFAGVMNAQDESQQLCSVHKNTLPTEMVADFLTLQKSLIQYPESGELMGDWESGMKIFSDSKTGNCYACHQAVPSEVAAGNVGPMLTNYGQRGTSEAIVKYTYEKIYNAWAYQPCSSMYRAGVNGRIDASQAADIVAFLLTPESPINPALNQP
ncbi:MAG: sulfur oxidation c-type cytochrome SoxX [Deinococcales bacterium]